MMDDEASRMEMREKKRAAAVSRLRFGGPFVVDKGQRWAGWWQKEEQDYE